VIAIRNAANDLGGSPAGIDHPCDIDRNQTINVLDAIWARMAGSNSQTALKMITAPSQ